MFCCCKTTLEQPFNIDAYSSKIYIHQYSSTVNNAISFEIIAQSRFGFKCEYAEYILSDIIKSDFDSDLFFDLFVLSVDGFKFIVLLLFFINSCQKFEYTPKCEILLLIPLNDV